MNEIDWIKFKRITEEKFNTATLKECWGFQIQKDTKWNAGLNKQQIEKLEEYFGFKYPLDYIDMLKAFNGFETLQISIDPEGKEENEFARRCYKYPDDLFDTKWLIDEANQYIEYANKALEEAGFDSTQLEGFVPLYGHRALAVLKDKSKSPVLSIWGDDIIIYGKSLIEYWCHELYVEFKN